jgi:hypothetical protein
MLKPIMRAAIIACSITLVLLAGCSKKAPVDPLMGWQFLGLDALDHNTAISADYHSYIAKLQPDEKNNAGIEGFYKNGSGQLAVRIEISKNGTWWIHDLIYDKNNVRIKTIIYINGHYRS